MLDTGGAGLIVAIGEQGRIRILGSTNAAVFNDLYWQHLAYLKGGFPLLEKIYKKEGLDKTDSTALEGWRLISIGKIQEGNLKLLLHEQEKIVQQYAFSGKLAMVIGEAESRKGVRSPIPGGTPFPKEKNIAVLKDRLEWMPTVMSDFQRFKTNTGREELIMYYFFFAVGGGLPPKK